MDALKKVRDNKAPGTDGLWAELIKSGEKYLQQKIFQMVKRVWAEEIVPNEWKISVVCPILKKGDPLDCKNYRRISLLCSAYKILSNILFERLKPYVEREIGEYQGRI